MAYMMDFLLLFRLQMRSLNETPGFLTEKHAF